MWKYQETDELYNTLMHHGIVGMKWGIRRYQNKDGSLTSAGRRRQKNNPFYKKAQEKKKQETQKKNTNSKKRMKDVSDDDLRRMTNRMRLENDYVRTKQEYNKLNQKRKSLGRRFVESLGKDVLLPAARDAGKNVVQAYFQKEFRKTLGLPLDDNKKNK